VGGGGVNFVWNSGKEDPPSDRALPEVSVVGIFLYSFSAKSQLDPFFSKMMIPSQGVIHLFKVPDEIYSPSLPGVSLAGRPLYGRDPLLGEGLFSDTGTLLLEKPWQKISSRTNTIGS
jgi:hypothetical protein